MASGRHADLAVDAGEGRADLPLPGDPTRSLAARVKPLNSGFYGDQAMIDYRTSAGDWQDDLKVAYRRRD